MELPVVHAARLLPGKYITYRLSVVESWHREYQPALFMYSCILVLSSRMK